MIIILAGKSASGKDTILKHISRNYGYEPIVSVTSRPMREHEIDGVDYNFITKEKFKDMIQHGCFLEYNSYETIFKGHPDTWYYGSCEVNPNDNHIVVLDVSGIKKYINHYGKDNCIIFYIVAQEATRKIRAMRRGSFSDKEWDRREKADSEKFNSIYEIADVVIPNENITIPDISNTIIQMVKEIKRC